MFIFHGICVGCAGAVFPEVEGVVSRDPCHSSIYTTDATTCFRLHRYVSYLQFDPINSIITGVFKNF